MSPYRPCGSTPCPPTTTRLPLPATCLRGRNCRRRARQLRPRGSDGRGRPGACVTCGEDPAERLIDLGPQAQAVLLPFLRADLDAWLFSPAESMAAYRAGCRAERIGRGGVGSHKPRRPGYGTLRRDERRPRVVPGGRYTVDSYRRAIARACDRAWPPPKDLRRRAGETIAAWLGRLEAAGLAAELRAWQRRHRWHPHQLRHTFATAVRKRFGAEAARVALGHASLDVTEIYAERDRELSRRIAREVG